MKWLKCLANDEHVAARQEGVRFNRDRFGQNDLTEILPQRVMLFLADRRGLLEFLRGKRQRPLVDFDYRVAVAQHNYLGAIANDVYLADGPCTQQFRGNVRRSDHDPVNNPRTQAVHWASRIMYLLTAHLLGKWVYSTRVI